MMFVYKNWQGFCEKLGNKHIHSIRAIDVLEGKVSEPYLVLKHDVETNVARALKMARIEHEFGHIGSYYVQAYLLKKKKNLVLLQEMHKMGHEISYHYDVMDSNMGNLDNAIAEFEMHKKLFEENGFNVTTVCQHGNPIVQRLGYTSNRDFFRSEKVKDKFSTIADLMVNFKDYAKTDYIYYSDAGRHFQLIHDPLNNDIINSDDKNVVYEDLEELIRKGAIGTQNCIVSIHPHRWTKSIIVYQWKSVLFKAIKNGAKLLIKIPVFKKLMSQYYFLAKKI